MPRKPEPHVENKIIVAATNQIRSHGVNRLRVAEVAREAGTTVAMVYRRFGDRDGLIDATVAHFYETRIREAVARAEKLLYSKRPISIDDVLAALPTPQFDGSVEIHQLLSRVTYLAVENASFEVRIRRLLEETTPTFEDLLEAVVRRLPEGQRFDPRIVTLFVMSQDWNINDLRGHHKVTNQEYLEFVRNLMLDSQYRPRA